jgi:branched-subunit amino acid permease
LKTIWHEVRKSLLFIGAVLIGSLLAGILTTIEYALTGSSPPNLLFVFGITGTYLVFASIPALLFGLPVVQLLRRRGIERWPATAIMFAGGIIVGVFLMFITFTGLEKLGATAGGSIGFMFGLLLFDNRSTAEE